MALDQRRGGRDENEFAAEATIGSAPRPIQKKKRKNVCSRHRSIER